ncbi:site-2 protease family protein [Cohnella yongneupensis]|uniref:Site-2 protease family protein n=1 Tax=Cohnella yongneupensis TaxID=425006 RepID=A0ABW0R8E9_9BACL
MSLFWFPIEYLPVIVLIMLVAFTVHEWAHAWTAWKFGDDTAYREGRVTLNPRAHLDLIGMLFLLLAGFGWAKPVPVRRSRFKNPRVMSILVTAAGPISNFLLAFVFLLAIDVLHAFGLFADPSASYMDRLIDFISLWWQINLALFLFNLIPIPPLDGYRIVEEFLPIRTRIQIQEKAQWATFIFLLLIFLPPLRDHTIGPLMDLRIPIVKGMIHVLNAWFPGGFFAYWV